MKTAVSGRPFHVIGENIHATRTIARGGRRVAEDVDGVPVVLFQDAAGQARQMPVIAPVRDSADFLAGRVKHVRNAILTGMAAEGLVDEGLGGPRADADAQVANAYLVHLAVRQQATGADWLDVNVDEISGDLATRSAAMTWIVRLLEAAPEISVPISLDSSSSEVLRAGLDASEAPHGQLLLNSASLERPDVVDLAVRYETAAVVSAAGADSLPADAAGRVANTRQILEVVAEAGIPLDRCHLDPLVMPAGVDPEAGVAFLDASREIRDAYGPDLHITGGLSNVSFGLPGRRLLNDVFIALAIAAGVDSGIVDPIGADFDRIAAYDRSALPFTLAQDLLVGRDPYGMEYLTAFRAGLLAAALA